MSQTKPDARAKTQAFGGFLTAMVIPNMGAFIAWGLLTALFIPTGWLPNEHLAQLVGPLINYMLPILLGYTGGSLVHGQRGGVAGVIGTVGLIVGSTIPMFLGAMIMGPLSAWIIKKWDQAVQPRIKPGFEMVVNNFALGIIGFGLTLLSFLFIGPAVQWLNKGLTAGVNAMVSTNVLPILALLNEPAKVLFLNNVIDQGIYYPLGMQEAATAGKSIFFMVASNPGPGLGLLLAYWAFSGSKVMKETAPGAIIIHFLGGIHEIYFPYVLAKPITILGMIGGAASGIAVAQVMHVGLVAGPSPGSVFAYALLTPKGNLLGVTLDIVVATAVSFLINAALLKHDRKKDAALDEEKLEELKKQSSSMKQQGKEVLAGALGSTAPAAVAGDINTITFACDAGMGSSTMGASLFRKRVQDAGINVTVNNTSIEKIPDDADLVIVHKNLAERTRAARPDLTVVTIDNYLNDPALEELFEQLSVAEEATK